MGFLSGLGSILSGAGALGSLFGGDDKSAQIQHYYNTNAIQMRVKDAEKAGIHPLYALGVSSPQTVQSAGSENVFDKLSEAGQNVGRAISAYQTKSQRDVQEMSDSLTLENMRLQNDLLRSQISQINRPTTPPIPDVPYILDGQGQSGARENNTIPDVGFVRTEQGGLAPIYSDAVKQRVEDSFLPEIEWYARNRLSPSSVLFGTGKPPMSGWYWNASKQQWLPPDGSYWEKFHRYWKD